MNDNPTLPQEPLNKDITECIRQLAERAEELGEKNTAIVLFTLAGHRVIRADAALAYTAAQQARLMKDALEAERNKHG